MGRPSEFSEDVKLPSIYGLCDSVTGELRYIGKAVNPAKRLAQHMRECRRRNTPLYAWLRKHGEPSLKILEGGCSDWRASERRLIAKARGDGAPLLNLADGGDEPLCTVDVRRRCAATALAKRPKHIVRAYRVLEANIRSLKRLGRHEAAERITGKLKVIIEAVDAARREGRLDKLNERIGAFLNGRERKANGLSA